MCWLLWYTHIFQTEYFTHFQIPCIQVTTVTKSVCFSPNLIFYIYSDYTHLLYLKMECPMLIDFGPLFASAHSLETHTQELFLGCYYVVQNLSFHLIISLIS